MTDRTPDPNRRAYVHNAISDALGKAGDWVPLSTRIAATRAALAEVDAWHAAGAEPAVPSAPTTPDLTPYRRLLARLEADRAGHLRAAGQATDGRLSDVGSSYAAALHHAAVVAVTRVRGGGGGTGVRAERRSGGEAGTGTADLASGGAGPVRPRSPRPPRPLARRAWSPRTWRRLMPCSQSSPRPPTGALCCGTSCGAWSSPPGTRRPRSCWTTTPSSAAWPTRRSRDAHPQPRPAPRMTSRLRRRALCP
jgi:hypothetical protein